MFPLNKVEPSSTRHAQKLRARSKTIGQSNNTTQAHNTEPMPTFKIDSHSSTRGSPNSKTFLGMPLSSRITRSRPQNVPIEFIGVTNDPNLLGRAGPSVGPRSSSISPESAQTQSQTRTVNLKTSPTNSEKAIDSPVNSSFISSVETVKPIDKGKEIDLSVHLLEGTTRYLTLDG